MTSFLTKFSHLWVVGELRERRKQETQPRRALASEEITPAEV